MIFNVMQCYSEDLIANSVSWKDPDHACETCAMVMPLSQGRIIDHRLSSGDPERSVSQYSRIAAAVLFDKLSRVSPKAEDCFVDQG